MQYAYFANAHYSIECWRVFQDESCPVCQAVSHSDEHYPPQLPRVRKPGPPFLLQGAWLSTHCETRPNNLRLTRHVIFDGGDNATWQAYYHHFYDELCQQPMFSLRAQGSFLVGKPSLLVEGAYDVDFTVTNVKVTARDPRIMRTLNDWEKSSEPCGGKEKWLLNREQDVTDSKGCPPLGITVTAVERELIRIDKDHHNMLLFMGQRPTKTDYFHQGPLQRPTSFQPPLARCDQGQGDHVTNHVIIVDRISEAAYGSGSEGRPASCCVGVLLLWGLVIMLVNI